MLMRRIGPYVPARLYGTAADSEETAKETESKQPLSEIEDERAGGKETICGRCAVPRG